MKQVVQSREGIKIIGVNKPILESGCVLIEVYYSLISAGTEKYSLQNNSGGIIKKAILQPEKVKKIFNLIRTQGYKRVFNLVQGKMNSVSQLGYSCSGVVSEVAEDVRDIFPGDRVACAGAGKANHAEWVVVPRNLVVRIPDNVSLRDAASATLGAIAMQGVRRADLRLGEWAAVIGLGLLGQLTVQLLRASGVKVIGFDLDQKRVDKAKKCGLSYGFVVTDLDPIVEVMRLTDRFGVDATIITAASKSNYLVQQAIQMTRKRGKVVVVGSVGLGLQRSPLYEKEIDFLISCSYGPGRYDPFYEEKGMDYPYPYVRWTENRNLAEYLNLIENGLINFENLIDEVIPVEQARKAYEILQGLQPVTAVLLSYSNEKQKINEVTRNIGPKTSGRHKKDIIRLALVGVGGFAQGMHLPNIMQLPSLYQLRAVVSKTGVNARNVAKQFHADYGTTNYEDVLSDPDIDAVMICTRHNLHARQAIQAIEAGKAVFVEKPMALNLEELEAIEKSLQKKAVPFMVGFNRRFSPSAIRLKKFLNENTGPLMVLYRVNAGYIPHNYWVHGPEGGGRIIGEACHMIDLIQYLLSPAKIQRLQSLRIRSLQENLSGKDNVSVNMNWSDGSLATLLYTSLGSNDFSKEYLEIYAGERVLVLDDFKNLRVYGSSDKGWQSDTQDKGHLNELKVFASYVMKETESPISLEELISTTKICFAIERGCDVFELIK
jgi:predicted dehydrogenase/threonine dehydrogenase-like Zn-dependent dehydrogenase